MIDVMDLGQAALQRDALRLRSLIQDLERSDLPLATIPAPTDLGLDSVRCAAAIISLLATRRGEQAPAWTQQVPPSDERVFLVAAAEKMPRLRSLCEEQSPEALRQRGYLAPPDFLTSL